MKRAVALVLAGMLLAGCSTVGNVFKKTGQVLMDPSIPVGTPDDQPTQIALSLYAGADVNPNPVSEPAIESDDVVGPVDTLDEGGPFAISFSGATQEDVVRGLRALLDRLEDEGKAKPPASKRPSLRTPARGALDEAHPPLPGDSAVPGVQRVAAAANPLLPPLPPHWPSHRYASDDLSTGEPGHAPNLGQYRKSASLTEPGAPAPATTTAATPVSFRVIQLKDDAMLVNGSLELIQQNPKKALGSAFLAADDYILAPGQFKFIEFSPIETKARYVAVVANFHDPNANRSYDVYRLEPRGRKYALLITLQDTRVAITDEAYRPPRSAATSPSKKP
ncbi:type VI secretion system lipoprotein TssJ [Burkholderia sp. IMCC1007]|uniref:type VI secretion system lipoprotein TssJ n=1 Tax=Burkholderia sp. IMCC1007 TaxID=3004104 RepID=UPI0022B46AFB|nr:type VI secretion system lipoprotein TssJ [Burkholderia sp. IMCC1007]